MYKASDLIDKDLSKTSMASRKININIPKKLFPCFHKHSHSLIPHYPLQCMQMTPTPGSAIYIYIYKGVGYLMLLSCLSHL